MKEIHEKISRLAELAAGWETHEAVGPLERDLALELLRELYADIKFAKHGAGTFEHAVPTEEEVVVEQIIESIAEPEPADCVFPEPEPVATPEEIIIPEPVVEPEPLAKPEPAAEEPEPLPEPEPAPASEDIPVIPRRVDPGVIRSLYGEPERRQMAAQEPVRVQESPKEESPVKEKPAPPVKEAPQTAQAATIGDVMNSGRQTLGETLRNGDKDMASKIAAAERPDLRKSIGLNDKFLMIRDMFEGDADAFNDAVATLDTFTDLDEAIIYIHDTYNWSADSEGVKLLVELLERKLG